MPTLLVQKLYFLIDSVQKNRLLPEVKEDLFCYLTAVIDGKKDIDPEVLKFLFTGWFIHQNIENSV